MLSARLPSVKTDRRRVGSAGKRPSPKAPLFSTRAQRTPGALSSGSTAPSPSLRALDAKVDAKAAQAAGTGASAAVEGFLLLGEGEQLQEVPLQRTVTDSGADGSARDSPLNFLNPVEIYRDKLAADPRFPQKVGIEVTIDSVCSLLAEVASRGAAAFGSELPFVLDDLLTTVLLDTAMVTIMTPSAAKQRAAGTCPAPPDTPFEAFKRDVECKLGEIPNSVFEMSPPGREYTLADRAACLALTALQYGTLGIVCGGIAEAVTELLPAPATASELPGVIPVALLWAKYMAFSCAIRYQLVGGIESFFERSPIGKSAAALVVISAATRFGNNVYGAGEFVGMMKELAP